MFWSSDSQKEIYDPSKKAAFSYFMMAEKKDPFMWTFSSSCWKHEIKVSECSLEN